MKDEEMNMDVLVSAVVLTYNSSDTVIETLESIKAQTYSPLELVICDDCSQDETKSLIEEWLKENESRFYNVKRVYAEANTGLSGNMNRGLREASGKYIKYMAADDLLSPDAIEKYTEFAQTHDKVIPIAKVWLIAEDGKDVSSVQSYCEKCYMTAKENREIQYKKMLFTNWIVACAADFFEKKVLLDLGGYDEHYRLIEDYPMHMKLLKNGYSFGFIDAELTGYRVSASSITGSRAQELKRTEMKIFFRQKFWYMFQNGMGWEAIKQTKYWLKIFFSIKKGQ